MAFCAECRYEYLPEIEVCPDCGAALVDELPELDTDYENINWVSMTPLSGTVYARMVTNVLDQRGIPNYVQSMFGSGGLGQISGAGFVGASAKIYVPDEHLEEAAQIQDEMMKDV